jgi:hypothetical protein
VRLVQALPSLELLLGELMAPQRLLDGHLPGRDCRYHRSFAVRRPLVLLYDWQIGRVAENVTAAPHGLDVMLPSSCLNKLFPEVRDGPASALMRQIG